MEDAFSRFTAELASVDAGARMPPPVSKKATVVVCGLVRTACDWSGRQASQPRRLGRVPLMYLHGNSDLVHCVFWLMVIWLMTFMLAL